MKLLAAEEPRAEGQALGAVVVPGDEDHAGPDVEDQTAKHVVEEGHGLGRRDSPVVNIPGDDDRVRFRAAGQVHELIQKMGLVVGEVHPEEDPAEMPVRCVDEAHGRRPQTNQGSGLPLKA